MRKILSALLLSLVFILPGCNPFSQHCNLDGPANVRYHLTYPCVAGMCGPINDIATGTVGADGHFRFPKLGHSCSTLQNLVRFGSNLGLALSASPSSIYLPTPPTSGTITGQSFDTTYGMPQVEYFDSYGYFLGAVSATSVSGGGTSLQANMPDLSYVYSGSYQVKVTNKTYDGYYLNIVGSATLTGWGRDRLDSDGDGWYDDEDCYPDDPFMNCSSGICGGGQEPIYVCP